jgi:hypothetical protein
LEKHFLSFGGGSEDYRQACEVICEQASAMGFFDGVHRITDLELQEKAHHIFFEKCKNFILQNRRGYGFWIWKSYLVKWIADQLSDGDLLIYADAGCRLSDVRRMNLLFEHMATNEFLIEFTGHSHKPYTSQLVLKELDSQNIIRDERMISAGFFALILSKRTRNLLNDWFEQCQRTEYLKDPNSELEPVGFVDHRHDQTLLSLTLHAKYKDFLPKETNRILSGAIIPLRLRSKKSDHDILKYQKHVNYLKPIAYEDFDTFILSSGNISIENANDLVTLNFKKDFSFCTKAELSPSISLRFKEKKLIKTLIIENRKFHGKTATKLFVDLSTDGFTFDRLLEVTYKFGGLYDDNPLIINFSSEPILAIKISAHHETPDVLTLKSLYLYESLFSRAD